MKLAIHCAVMTVLAVTAAAAFAAGDPQPATGNQAPATQSGPASVQPAPTPAAGLPDLPENQAEIEAMNKGELTFEQPAIDAPAPAIDAAAEARRAAFDGVVAEQNAKVQALGERLATTTGSEARVALQKDIEREKLATGRRLLELQLELATGDGDAARIERLQAAITEWDNPVMPQGAIIDRPVPANPGR